MLRLPRRAPAPLPEALRGRLLAIPAAAPRLRAPAATSPADTVLGWLLASPATPLVAGFVLALGLSLAWGNPYQAGAATLDRVRDQARPATSRLHHGVTAFATKAAELGEGAIAVLPRAGLRASRTVSALLSEGVAEDDATNGIESRSRP